MTSRVARVASDEQRALRWRVVWLACTVPLAVTMTAGSSTVPPGWSPYLTVLLGFAVVVTVANVALTWYTSRATRASVTVASGEVIACRVVPGEHDGVDVVPNRPLDPLEQVVDHRVGTYGARPVRFVVRRGYHFGVTPGGPGRPDPPQSWVHPARPYATSN